METLPAFFFFPAQRNLYFCPQLLVGPVLHSWRTTPASRMNLFSVVSFCIPSHSYPPLPILGVILFFLLSSDLFLMKAVVDWLHIVSTESSKSHLDFCSFFELFLKRIVRNSNGEKNKRYGVGLIRKTLITNSVRQIDFLLW